MIQGAKVVLTDQQKGFTFSTTSDSNGRYLFRSIPPAIYAVSAEIEGFEKATSAKFKVDVNENATTNLSLKVAGASQTIQVAAEARTIQTEDAETGQVVNRRFINDLPLIDRNVIALTSLAPGVTEMDDQCDATCTGTNFVSNGSRGSTADILTDGASVTNSEPNGGVTQATYLPSPEAIEEFKVQQTNFSAEYGFSGASVVNMITRSGTNRFHGSAYDFVRDSIFDANDWFANRFGQPLPPLRRNNYGFTLGGPIIKNKTFFFVDYDGVRSSGLSTATFGVATDLMRNGDFGEAPVMNIVVLQSDQAQDGRAHIGVIGPGLPVDSAIFDTLANVTDPGGRDLALNIAVVPGEALTAPRRDERARVRGGAGGRTSSEEKPVGVSEWGESGRAEGIGGDHVQRLHAGMVHLRNHDVVLDHAGVWVQPAEPGQLPLQVADDGIGLIAEGLSASAVDIHRRRVIGVHGENSRVSELGENHAAQVGVDFAHAIIDARYGYAVAAIGSRRIAYEVITFVNGKYEQCIALVDSVGGEPVEELLEGLIIGLQLLGVAVFSRAIGEVDVAGGSVRVMRVGDVGIGDRDTGFLHLGNVSQRNRGLHAIETGETGVSVGVLNHIAVEVGHGTAGLDDGIDVCGTEQAVEAVVAARLVIQYVCPRVG